MLQKKDARNKILLVEDSLLNQRMISDILSGLYTLEAAGTAAEAAKLIESFEPDLILLDIVLPDANGFDILRKLKESSMTADIPVIIISGMDSDADEEKGFELGAVDYIKKPFKNAIVRARIGTQIRIINQMKTIERMSFIDALTSIGNRRAFDSQIKYEWGRAVREKQSLSMMMLDVDNFKQYNDTYGHQQGDLMLQAVARTLDTALKRSMDIICRYGGEEFAVILPDTSAAGAQEMAEKIRAHIEAMEVLIPQTKKITKATISIGVASIYPESSDCMEDFIKAADQMLYKAKENGRNQVQAVQGGAGLKKSGIA